ncbi:MAG TPA: hypothetical protein VGN12_16910 [Pirellulales bacterium]|jgi:hypothetical protein
MDPDAFLLLVHNLAETLSPGKEINGKYHEGRWYSELVSIGSIEGWEFLADNSDASEPEIKSAIYNVMRTEHQKLTGYVSPKKAEKRRFPKATITLSDTLEQYAERWHEGNPLYDDTSEPDILALLEEGRTEREIADILGITRHAVRVRRERLQRESA